MLRFTTPLLLALAACTATSDAPVDTDTDGATDAPTDAPEDTDVDEGPECVTHEDCDVHDYCDDGTCEPVYDHRYAVGSIEIRIDPAKPDGRDWDPGGDEPDPYYELYVNGELKLTEDPKRNDLTVTWTGDHERVFSPSDFIRVVVKDDDLAADDDIITADIGGGSLTSLFRTGSTERFSFGTKLTVRARRLD